MRTTQGGSGDPGCPGKREIDCISVTCLLRHLYWLWGIFLMLKYNFATINHSQSHTPCLHFLPICSNAVHVIDVCVHVCIETYLMDSARNKHEDESASFILHFDPALSSINCHQIILQCWFVKEHSISKTKIVACVTWVCFFAVRSLVSSLRLPSLAVKVLRGWWSVWATDVQQGLSSSLLSFNWMFKTDLRL